MFARGRSFICSALLFAAGLMLGSCGTATEVTEENAVSVTGKGDAQEADCRMLVRSASLRHERRYAGDHVHSYLTRGEFNAYIDVSNEALQQGAVLYNMLSTNNFVPEREAYEHQKGKNYTTFKIHRFYSNGLDGNNNYALAFVPFLELNGQRYYAHSSDPVHRDNDGNFVLQGEDDSYEAGNAICPNNAVLDFTLDNMGSTPQSAMPIVASKALTIKYDYNRLAQCRDEFDPPYDYKSVPGCPDKIRSWRLDAHIDFILVDGKRQFNIKPLVQEKDIYYHKTTLLKEVNITVPSNAKSVEIYFANYNTNFRLPDLWPSHHAPDCEQWDSNQQQNYIYQVEPTN